MKTKMMKISVILSFLLCWSFASSNLHREKLNDKSANGLNNINDASDTLNLATKKLSDEASSGKDWGGNVLNFLTFLNRKDLIDENDQADNKSFLKILISQGSKFIDNLISKSDLYDIPLFGNIITWVQENIEALGKLFTDDKKEKLNDRAKRDLGTSGLLRAKPHKGGISEHLLKLSEGSTSNVLKSEKATVAEALNGQAIRKILERAKAKRAKAAQHKNLFDNDDFNKWFLSKSTFDTDIFNHPFYRPSYNAKLTKYSEAEDDTDSSDRNTFSVLHHASEPTNRQETKHAFNMPDPAAVDTIVTERSHTKLLHKPEHQKHLSSKLQITSGEEYGHETNGMFHKPAVSPHTHGSLSHEDEEHTGLRHASSHAHVPHMHFRVTEDEETRNDVPKWKDIKWTHADSSRERAPHISRFAESNEFDTSDEMEGYDNRFIFKTLFEPREEGEDETIHIEYPENHEFSDEIYFEDMNDEDLLAALNSYERYYGIRNREYYQDFDNTKNRHLAGMPSFEHDSPINSYGEENIDRDKYSLDGVQRSAIYSTESNVETEEAVEEKQSGNMLITKISTDTPMKKQMNIDIENYHTRDQSVSANGATSFSSGLSDEKESKHTNNALAPTSADDGSATIKMKTEDDGVLGRTRSVIDNDATSAEIEMGFSEIKSHPPADLPLVHSSLSRAHSKMHLGNEKVHHSISEYQHSTVNTAASSETTDAKMSMESHEKNHDLKENQVVSADDAEATISVENERQYDLFRTVPLDDSREGDYTRTRKEFTNLKGMSHRNAARRKSIEVIDIDDRSAEVLLPEVHQLNGKEHILHDVNFYDLNDQEMRGDEIIEDDEYAEDLKENGIIYNGLEEEEEEEKQEEKEENIAIDSGMSEKSNINEHGFHNRYSQYRKSNQHDRHNHRHSEHNYHSDHNQHTNVHNQYSQYDRHAFNQYVRDIMSSSTVSDATKFEIWKKYLYFIRHEREQNNDESNASLESLESLVNKIRKKQYNTIDGEISLFTRGGKKHITDEDNHVHLRKYKNIRGPVAHSTEINKIISTRNNGETEIKSKDVMNNQNKNRETVTRTGSLISDGSIIDTASHTSISKKTRNNNHRKQISIKTMPLKNSREDIETNTKRVYDVNDRNENIDINTKQTTETVQSTDSESNLHHVLWKTSMNGAVKQIMTREKASNEKIFSNSLMNGHQNHNNLQKTSDSSSSTVKSQIQTKHHSSEKSENNDEINTNVEGLIETISSSDAMAKSRSNIHNAVASSKSSDELQIRLQHDWNNFENNKNYNMNAEASADATDSMGVKNKQESNSENTLSFSESSAKSEAQVENYSDNLNTWKNTVHTGALSETVIKSVESDMRGKKTLDNFEDIQINANAEKLSTAISDNERYQISAKNKQSSSKGFQTKFDYHLINGEDSQTNAISKASTETILSNIIKNEDLSDLQKSFSSSSAISSEKLQAESDYNSNNLRNSQMSVSTAESSSKSTSSDNIENVYASGTSKSSSSKLTFKESHIKNEQYSGNINNVITNVETASSDNVRNHHRYESKSSSLSSSHAKSQVENKNIKTSMSTSNNVISDINQHHLLHTLSSYNAGKNDPNDRKYDPQSIDNDNHGHEDNILKTSLTDSTNEDIEKSESNKSIEKSEFIKQDSEDASSAARSVKTTTSTDVENIQNIMSVLSLKSSEAGVSKSKQKYDMNHLKEEERIIDDSIIGMSRKVGNNHQNQLPKTSSVFNSHRISEANKENHIGIVQNNRESIAAESTASSESTSSADNRKSQNELKETTLSASFTETQEKQNNLNVPKKSEGITSKMAMETFDIFNSEKVQMDDKLNDKIEVKTADSIINNVINSGSHIKDANSINEMVSTTFNRFNRANQNNILKVTSSDDLYTEMPRENKYSSNDLSDVNSISNVNVQNKDPYEITSSVDIKSQSMICHKSGISKNKEIINSNTHNNINEWRTDSHTTESSSSYAEWQNKRENTMKTTVSAESTANSINEDIRNYDLMQDKFLSDHANIAQIDKEHNYGNKKVEKNEDNSKGSISAEISSSGISQIKFDTKEKAFVASQSQQHDFNVQKEDKAITSNTLLSTEETNFSEMRNARQELLEASSNSRTEVQHELISDIAKKSSEVTTSAATSAQTMSSEKVEGESEEKLIKDSAESNSYAKSQVISNIDSNISKEGKLIGNIETSTNSAASNHLKNIQQNKLVEKNSLFDPAHEMFDGNVPINNFANAADATVSTQESIIKEYQSGATKTAFNSYTEAQTEHEYDSSMEQQLMETTSSADVKVRAENKNIVNNMQESLKAAANAISSSNIENINKHDASKILSSNSYTGWNNEQNKINMHTRNFARDNKKSTITKSSATSLVLDENQEEREDNFMREILQSNSQNQRITKVENHNDNTLRKNLHNSEDTAASEQATSIIKNEHQDNLLKELQKDESSSFRNQHLITTDSMASSNSMISACVNKIDKNDHNELTATSSSNSYVKSSMQNQNDINVLKTDHTDFLSASTSAMIDSKFKDMEQDKSLEMTSSSDSYAETQSKSERTNSIKKDSDVINAKTETISSNDIKDIGVHNLFDLLANSAAKVQTERESSSQEGMYKENISKTSSNLFSKIDSARNLKILEKNRENSAITNTMTETESSDQHNYSHKTEYSNTQDSQYNIKSMSSANSHVTSQASKDVTKSERAKENGEVTVNLSTLGKAEAYNKVKEAHSYDWLATSGATLAEERTQNKDKFNILGKAEEVAVHAATSAEAATSNGIESKHRDIYAKDPSDYQDNWESTKIIQDAISSTSTETTEAFKETKSEKESKNILTTLASADAEILINDREKCSVSHNLESSANTEEMHSTTSAMSSVSSSTSDNTNIELGKIYNQINDEISTPTISPILKDNTRGEERLFSIKTSLLPPDKINRCNENVETKEFINEATSLYKVLNKKRNSEILLMKKNPEGLVQIASLKNTHSVPPLIAYRLVPREVYERIRTIIANKQIFCANCPLSDS